MADPREELLREVSIGLQAETFLGSDVGKYLVSRAEGERDAALDELKTVNPNDPEAIMELQAKVWRAESVQTWIAELIQAGWNAEGLIGQMDSTD